MGKKNLFSATETTEVLLQGLKACFSEAKLGKVTCGLHCFGLENNFQELELIGHYNLSLSFDAAILVWRNCPVIV